MKYAFALIPALILSSPAMADCPDGADYGVQIADIVDRMKVAPHEGAARQLSAEMWDIWLDAPDAIAQSMLDEGLAMLQIGATGSSRRVLTRLVDYCPEYAEGYNQRAFAAFLSGDFEAALVDLDIAIDLQPVHLGALTGKAMTLIRLGRDEEAQAILREALAINPWLSERALLDEPPGEDI